MKQHFEAVYENGVLRPLEPLQLRDSEKVTVTIHACFTEPGEEEWLDTDLRIEAEKNADPAVTLQEVRAALATIKGAMADTVIAERGEY
jgi:predicted DNA-binding antitoxin AbrB/MazE fold protein